MKQKLKKIGRIRNALIGTTLAFSLLTGCDEFSKPIVGPKTDNREMWAMHWHIPAYREAYYEQYGQPARGYEVETDSPGIATEPREAVTSNTNLEDYIAGTFGSAESREIAGRDYRIIDVPGNGAFFVDAINYSKFIDKLRQLDMHLKRQDGHGIRNSNELAGIVNLMAIDDEIVSQAEIQNLDKPDQFGALLYDVRDTVYHYHN